MFGVSGKTGESLRASRVRRMRVARRVSNSIVALAMWPVWQSFPHRDCIASVPQDRGIVSTFGGKVARV